MATQEKRNFPKVGDLVIINYDQLVPTVGATGVVLSRPKKEKNSILHLVGEPFPTYAWYVKVYWFDIKRVVKSQVETMLVLVSKESSKESSKER